MRIGRGIYGAARPPGATCRQLTVVSGPSSYSNTSMRAVYLLWLLPLLAAGTGEEARDLGYEPYDSPAYPDSRWQFTPSAPAPQECSSPWRPLVAGLVVGALVKLPLLLLGKLLLLKTAAPLAVAGALLPLGLFSIYRAAVGQQQGSANSTARLLPQSCLQAAACGIGSVAPKTAVASTSWLLKAIGEAVEKEWAEGGQVEAYRQAYMKGAASLACPEYACPLF